MDPSLPLILRPLYSNQSSKSFMLLRMNVAQNEWLATAKATLRPYVSRTCNFMVVLYWVQQSSYEQLGESEF